MRECRSSDKLKSVWREMARAHLESRTIAVILTVRDITVPRCHNDGGDVEERRPSSIALAHSTVLISA